MNNFILFLCIEDGGPQHALTQFTAEFNTWGAAEAAGKRIICQFQGYNTRVFVISEKGAPNE